MAYIYIDFDNGVPRLAYTGCSRCSSLIGVSLCKIKTEGAAITFRSFIRLKFKGCATRKTEWHC